MKFPTKIDHYTDTYFLRSLEILKKEQVNPFVRAQIFIRKGPGKVYGISEAVAFIESFSKLHKNGGRVFSLQEGDVYASGETIMLLEARVQDIIHLETLLLGIISDKTTIINDKTILDLKAVQKNVFAITSIVGERPVIYFGARHYHYRHDKAITKAAFAGGVVDAATDNGASVLHKKGVGTIPHALECVFAWKYGLDDAVLKTTQAFDAHIDPKVPRIALVDFRNCEIDDSLKVAKSLQEKLYGIRIDTCGENVMQGARKSGNKQFWYGKGVTISGVYAVRKALDAAGFGNVKIILSSGFGNSEKVKAFVEAEKELGITLFDALGVGQVFPVRAATMDIVGVGESIKTIKPIAKVGRTYHPNPRLELT